MASEIQSIVPARCCAAWLTRDISDGSRVAVSTSTPERFYVGLCPTPWLKILDLLIVGCRFARASPALARGVETAHERATTTARRQACREARSPRRSPSG